MGTRETIYMGDMGAGLDETLAERAQVMGRSVVLKFIGGAAEAGGIAPGEVPGDSPAPVRTKAKPGGPGIVQPSRQIPETDSAWADMATQGKILTPPYDPWQLVVTVEESDTLPVMVEAMATNVAGHGLDVRPTFPTEDQETGQRLQPPEGAQAQREQVDRFVASCCPELGLDGLVDRMVRDYETVGWCCVEVLRNRAGEVAAFDHVRAYQVRLGSMSKPILVDVPVRNPVTGEIEELPRYRRFRTYVHLRQGTVTYFKEFGDPRYLNWRSGQYSEKSWGTDDNGNNLDATELKMLAQYSVHSDYGVPRWVGAAPHIRASRSAGELVACYFDDAPIGLKLLMVSGGSVSNDSMTRALSKISEQARGVGAAFSLVAIEAEPTMGTLPSDPLDGSRPTAPRMELQDVAWQLDANLYKGDDSLIEVNSRRQRRMWRMPPIFSGDADDYSRASAETSVAVAESQVFGPARKPFHRWWNGELLPSMGIAHWQLLLKSAAKATSDENLTPYVQGGGVSPNALGQRFAQLSGQEHDRIPEAWADRPLQLTMQLLQQGIDPNLSLAEAAAEVQARTDQRAKEAAERLQSMNDANGADGDQAAVREKAAKAALAIEKVRDLVELRDELVRIAHSTDEL